MLYPPQKKTFKILFEFLSADLFTKKKIFTVITKKITLFNKLPNAFFLFLGEKKPENQLNYLKSY